ncbi:MAG TPA: tetratricopeptide repeat protein [Vicinamibacteria bacterium]|nr:tetratricopeptide repeat protein [Vicinamibacteria bacterium]
MILPVLLLAALANPQETPAETPAATAAATPAESGSLDKGVALLRRGRYRSARAELEKAVAADPQSAAAQFYLGYSLYKIAEPTRRLTKEKEEAAQHFAACYSIDPGFRPAFGRAAK